MLLIQNLYISFKTILYCFADVYNILLFDISLSWAIKKILGSGESYEKAQPLPILGDSLKLNLTCKSLL